jgi:hypothetical protein
VQVPREIAVVCRGEFRQSIIKVWIAERLEQRIA